MGTIGQKIRALRGRGSRDEPGQVEPQDAGRLLERFILDGREITDARVVELGTRRSNPEVSTLRKAWFPEVREYLGVDFQDGLDVDLVADAHYLSQSLGAESTDIVVSCSTFEHFKYPFLAAHEIMKTLRVDGLLFVQTHQSFPLHAHPHDYFRFSCEALEALFPESMGFEIRGLAYEFPASIHSPALPQAATAAAHLNSCLYGAKKARTPDQFVYESERE